MISDVRVETEEDVFSENDVFQLRATGAPPQEARIACVAWTVNGESVSLAHRDALRHAVLAMRRRLDDYTLWLLACHHSVQSDSAVVRHRKLWGSLSFGGLAVPYGRRTDEVPIRSQDGIRYFGAVQMGFGGLEGAVAILEAEPASHVIAIRSDNERVVLELVQRGWTVPDFGPSLEVLFPVCAVDGIVFWPTGAFDDLEAGFVALAQPEVVHELSFPKR